MDVHVLGARGSIPTPGADFVRYGGNTSCVAIAADGAAPTLVLDAGTGLRHLGALLGGAPFRGALLLGHLHWDHVSGLPFSRAMDHPDAVVDAWLPAQPDGTPPIEVLRRAMSPPHFPIGPDGLHGRWTFGALEPGPHQLGGFEVLAREVPHKGGRTYGFRVTDGRTAVAYLSDHCPASLGPGPDGWGEYHDAALALADGVDLLIHDAQHTSAELPEHVTWGHSAAEYAVGLAERAAARSVLLFHHDPARTDDEVDAIVTGFADAPVPVSAAAEGTCLHLGRSHGAGDRLGG